MIEAPSMAGQVKDALLFGGGTSHGSGEFPGTISCELTHYSDNKLEPAMYSVGNTVALIINPRLEPQSG
jgi:hypothetical protein